MGNFNSSESTENEPIEIKETKPKSKTLRRRKNGGKSLKNKKKIPAFNYDNFIEGAYS